MGATSSLIGGRCERSAFPTSREAKLFRPEFVNCCGPTPLDVHGLISRNWGNSALLNVALESVSVLVWTSIRVASIRRFVTLALCPKIAGGGFKIVDERVLHLCEPDRYERARIAISHTHFSNPPETEPQPQNASVNYYMKQHRVDMELTPSGELVQKSGTTTLVAPGVLTRFSIGYGHLFEDNPPFLAVDSQVQKLVDESVPSKDA